MPCPATATILTGSQPAALGSPVTVIGVGGTFGPSSGTSGIVTLSRQTVTKTATLVLWNPTAVTFTVPIDLPAGAGAPEAWQILITPAGEPDCGPYTLQVQAG